VSWFDSPSKERRVMSIGNLTMKKGLRRACIHWDIREPELATMLRDQRFHAFISRCCRENPPELDDGPFS
jgi:hypothetical protein